MKQRLFSPRAPRRRKRVGAIVLIAVLAFLVMASSPAAGLRTDAEWILSAQLPDGAIAVGPAATSVSPYLANYAAIGLARATQQTGRRVYAAAAWKWLSWYQAHQDAQGFVTDYTVDGDTEVSTGTMDSTDAYAGTFLIAARAA